MCFLIGTTSEHRLLFLASVVTLRKKFVRMSLVESSSLPFSVVTYKIFLPLVFCSSVMIYLPMYGLYYYSCLGFTGILDLLIEGTLPAITCFDAVSAPVFFLCVLLKWRADLLTPSSVPLFHVFPVFDSLLHSDLFLGPSSKWKSTLEKIL